jgi:HSP20 family molecular chaperone IbpA
MSTQTGLVKTDTHRRLTPTQQRPVLIPLCDVHENDDELLIVADLPGVVPDGLDIQLDGNELTVRARRELAAGGAPIAVEHRDCDYHRRFSVPGGIDRDRIAAELRQGVLRLHLPKSPALKPRQIAVRAG